MATRSGFRPRPLDVNRDLSIVRDESELDIEEPVRDQQVVVKPDNTDKKPAFIPIPPVTLVPTYNTDYLPVHKVPITFLKGPRDKREIWAHEWQEYDLDVDDCQLLYDMNQGGTQDRITSQQLELVLWKLETLNYETIENMHMAGGTERASAAAFSNTDAMSKKDALEAIKQLLSVQHHILDRVFEYWKAKRKQLQRPILRRLVPPTPESDNNPYLVFRQRTKPNKPQTRRRRETHQESVERVVAMLDNFSQVLKLAEMAKQRESYKMTITNNFVDQGQYELLSLINGGSSVEHLDKRLNAAMKLHFRQRAFEPVTLPKPGDRVPSSTRKRNVPGPPIAEDRSRQKSRKRPKRSAQYKRVDAVAMLKPPPPPIEPCMVFTINAWNDDAAAEALQPSVDAIEDELNYELDTKCIRIGRNGRVYIDRCKVLDPSGPADAAGDSNSNSQDDTTSDLSSRLELVLKTL